MNASIFRNIILCFAIICSTFTLAYSKTTGYAAVNGIKMYYEIHGEGEPIVLLHGAYMTIDMNWNELIPLLSKTNKVIAVELQGHGRTADTDRPLSYPNMASDVAELMKHLKVDSANILGYSLGGTVAFQLAIANPELVKRLIIVSSVYAYNGWQPEVRDILKTFKPEHIENTPLKTTYDQVAPDPKHWRAFVEKMIAFDTKDYTLGEENIKNIKCPVLIIKGDNDGVDINHVARMYSLVGGGVFADMTGLPKSQLAIIPASTHVTLMMKTDKIYPVVNDFLNPPPQTTVQH